MPTPNTIAAVRLLNALPKARMKVATGKQDEFLGTMQRAARYVEAIVAPEDLDADVKAALAMIAELKLPQNFHALNDAVAVFAERVEDKLYDRFREERFQEAAFDLLYAMERLGGAIARSSLTENSGAAVEALKDAAHEIGMVRTHGIRSNPNGLFDTLYSLLSTARAGWADAPPADVAEGMRLAEAALEKAAPSEDPICAFWQR